MPESVERPQADEIEQLLEEWGQHLPEPPAATVAQTLQQLRLSSHLPRRKKPSRLRLTVLGTMAAAIVVVIVGGLILLASSTSTLNSPQIVSQGQPTVAAPTLTIALPAAVPSPTAIVVSTVAPATWLPATEPSPLPATATVVSATLSPVPTELPIIYSPIEQPTSAPTPVSPSATAFEVVPTNVPTTRPNADATALPNAPKPTPTIDDAPRNPVPPVKSPTPAPPPTVAPPQAPAREATTIFNGTISALDATGLTLNTNSERILITPATKILSNQKAVPFSSLAVGQSVSIQANRNAQGQLVAEVITIGVKLPPRVPPVP